ncbi:MCR1 [Candida theae]|uniref:NADH-cytochrome b5 reductase n=1 Tax=Candida theae TaxID=1198502 RepID=A0AAD5FZ76_9ASCO|nr:MCR1 [Candida theae]KAI5959210.1 MCR1 [Candida theae]
MSTAMTRFLAPRYVVPFIGATASLGVAYHYSTQSFIRNETGKTFTGGDEWIDLTLKKAEQLNHNTKHLVFDLKDKDDLSGLVVASMLMTKFVTPKGNNVIRPYTPVSDVNQKGDIEFVVKKYDEGKMSSHIHDLKEGETLSFKGPFVKWKWEPNQFKSIALIGGGSGITPLYQLLHAITSNPEDKTKVQLFYGNLSPDDILIKDRLDEIAKNNKEQVKITYFVNDKKGKDFDGVEGFITKDFLQKNLDKPSPDTKIFVCGPPGLYDAISGNKKSPSDQGEVTGALADLGYTKEHVFKF